MGHTTHQTIQAELIGHKIRQLRKDRKLSQTELSTRIGIQQSDLSRMEKGEYRVSLDTLFRILAEFRMSFGEFFEETARENLTPRDLEMVQSFKRLAPVAQRAVEEFIAARRLDGSAINRLLPLRPREREDTPSDASRR